MIFKLRFGKYRLTMTLAPVLDVIGVNSLLKDGNHILMWDFDEVPLKAVTKALHVQQLMHNLPAIRILETRPNEGYIAYCLTRCEFNKAIEIISGTMFICFNFLKWGVFRKRFTLRISHKHGTRPKLVKVLQSMVEEDVSVSELESFVQYETLLADRQRIFITLGDRYGKSRRI